MLVIIFLIEFLTKIILLMLTLLEMGIIQYLRILNMPLSTVRKIIVKYQDNSLSENKSGHGRKKFFSEQDEWMLIRIVNNDPKIRSAMMKTNLISIRASRSMMTQTHKRHGLKTYHHWKMPLMKNNLTAHLKFARDFLKKLESFWHFVLWSDETKLKLFGHHDRT